MYAGTFRGILPCRRHRLQDRDPKHHDELVSRFQEPITVNERHWHQSRCPKFPSGATPPKQSHVVEQLLLLIAASMEASSTMSDAYPNVHVKRYITKCKEILKAGFE